MLYYTYLYWYTQYIGIYVYYVYYNFTFKIKYFINFYGTPMQKKLSAYIVASDIEIKRCIYASAAVLWASSVEALGDIPIYTLRGHTRLPDDILFDIYGYIREMYFKKRRRYVPKSQALQLVAWVTV